MMKTMNILTGLLLALLVTTACSELDNYPAPDASIHGTITDAATNEPIQSQQPNGFRLRLWEKKFGDNVIPLDFWGMADGSFRNTKVFSGAYAIQPIDGPFFDVEPKDVDVNGQTEVNFTAIPYVRISADVQMSAGNQVVVSYALERGVKAGAALRAITECRTLFSTIPVLDVNLKDDEVPHDLSGMTNDEIEATLFEDVITGLQPGRTYYLRVAAKTDNPLNRFNYSRIFKVEL